MAVSPPPPPPGVWALFLSILIQNGMRKKIVDQILGLGVRLLRPAPPPPPRFKSATEIPVQIWNWNIIIFLFWPIW